MCWVACSLSEGCVHAFSRRILLPNPAHNRSRSSIVNEERSSHERGQRARPPTGVGAGGARSLCGRWGACAFSRAEDRAVDSGRTTRAQRHKGTHTLHTAHAGLLFLLLLVNWCGLRWESELASSHRVFSGRPVRASLLAERASLASHSSLRRDASCHRSSLTSRGSSLPVSRRTAALSQKCHARSRLAE